MKKLLIIGVLVISCFWAGANAMAAEGIAEQISLTVGKSAALLDTRVVKLDTPPMIVEGKTLVPLRFIGEAFGANVTWSGLEKQITVVQGSHTTKLWIGKTTAETDGLSNGLDVAPQIINGRTMVPLRFVAEAFSYQVDYQSASKLITLKKPNSPPQANFTVDKSFLMIGEAVNYTDLSTDPDGDDIVDRVWRNNNSSFQETGIFTVSLKVKDSRGLWSQWFDQTIEVSRHPNTDPVAIFTMDSAKVFVDQPVTYLDESYDPDDDDAIVDWVWSNRHESFSVPGIYYVSLMVKDRRGAWSSKYVQSIEVVVKPNQPPVAQFSVGRISIDQGETVVFSDSSYDPDGDKITEVQWTGKQRAYFKAGPVPVTLRIKDSRGMWSEPFTITLNVSYIVQMTEMAYNLNYPLAGETVNLTGINPLAFPELIPTSHSEDSTILLLSNSPETIKENGILYQDSATGLVRLMYHHSNGSYSKKRVYVLATNNGLKPASIIKTKEGFGGPNEDVLTTGRNGLARYLTSSLNERYDLAPGQVIILDGSGADRNMAYNQCVFSMMDLTVSGNINFTFVMVDAGSNVLTTYQGLPVLARDNHPRGTFWGVNRTVNLDVIGTQSQRFTLADNKVDSHLGGIDAMTGEQVSNAGNYGVVYRLQINAGTKMGLLTNPRGGVFRGVALDQDGQVYGMPTSGVISTGAQAVMNLTLNQGEETEFVFVPPAASNLPVLFLFVPFETAVASK